MQSVCICVANGTHMRRDIVDWRQNVSVFHSIYFPVLVALYFMIVYCRVQVLKVHHMGQALQPTTRSQQHSDRNQII